MWKERTHNIEGGGGVCVCVRSRGATDVYKEKTHNIKGGGCVLCMCVKNLLMCRVCLIE